MGVHVTRGGGVSAASKCVGSAWLVARRRGVVPLGVTSLGESRSAVTPPSLIAARWALLLLLLLITKHRPGALSDNNNAPTTSTPHIHPPHKAFVNRNNKTGLDFVRFNNKPQQQHAHSPNPRWRR